MHGLIAFGFVCDEFYLCLRGICGCENGGAHVQKISAAQHTQPAFGVLVNRMCVRWFIVCFPVEPINSKGCGDHADAATGIPSLVDRKGEATVGKKTGKEKNPQTRISSDQ
jgi:hypothetical protein